MKIALITALVCSIIDCATIAANIEIDKSISQRVTNENRT